MPPHAGLPRTAWHSSRNRAVGDALVAALRIARALYLDALPAGASQPTAAAVYDALTRFPSTTVRMVVAVGPVLALGGVEFLAVGEGPGDEDPGLTRTA